MTETMTIHKALSELKMLDNRIEKEIGGAAFAVANKHSNTKISGIPVADFIMNARDDYKSIRTLINRRNAIKRAVTRSNAVTMVTVGGKEYTVAEAIDMKNLGVLHLKQLCGAIESQFSRAKANAEISNGDKLEQRADNYVQSLYQGADMKNLGEEVRKMRDDFIVAQTMEVLDPICAVKETAALHDMIESFESEVDSALSVSNALTTVEVEYETM